MTYTQAAMERAMKVHEVLMQALNGRQPWIHVAEVLGVSARTVRRLRRRYELNGFTGLYDHPRRGPCRCPRYSGCCSSWLADTFWRAVGLPDLPHEEEIGISQCLVPPILRAF